MYRERMEIEQLVAGVAGVPSDSRDPEINWDHRSRHWAELAKLSESLIACTVSAAFCTAQEWDNRIDCAVQLEDGSVIGEMIGLDALSTERLHQTARRLSRRAAGEHVELVDPIQPPNYIGGPLPYVR